MDLHRQPLPGRAQKDGRANLTLAWSAGWELTALARHGHKAALVLWVLGRLGVSNVSKAEQTLPSPRNLKDVFRVLQQPHHTFYFSWGSLK